MDMEADRVRALKRQQDEAHHRQQVRRFAVADVVDDRMTVLTAAVLWGVEVSVLREWIIQDRPGTTRLIS